MLRVQDLTVHFYLDGAEFPVLDEVTFNIGPGEVVGLLGESGCGKTTTALSILRLLPAAGRVVRGSIRFRERELLGLDERQLQKVRGAEISLVFQEPEIMLNPVVRAGDQIAEVIRAHRAWSRRRCREEAESVLAQVCRPDTSRIYAAYPHQLSGGQRQRVAIAQALACKPALMIADEPTAALDTILQAEILTLLKDLKERLQIALLLISHDPAVLAKLEEQKKVLGGGIASGARSGAFIVDVASNTELNQMLQELPFWGICKWTATPLQTFRDRALDEKKAVDRMKASL